jgi:hypothetical protein
VKARQQGPWPDRNERTDHSDLSAHSSVRSDALLLYKKKKKKKKKERMNERRRRRRRVCFYLFIYLFMGKLQKKCLASL